MPNQRIEFAPADARSPALAYARPLMRDVGPQETAYAPSDQRSVKVP